VTVVDQSDQMIDPSPIAAALSADDDLATLWVKAYRGEVSGETLFAAMAAITEDPEHRRKWEVLRLLEARTREACVPAMERNGLPTGADPEVVKASLSWEDLLSFFEPITTEFLAVYRRIGEISDADRVESEILVAHEVALREFARRELAGRMNDSLALIEALPYMG
jgi:hypothetical protein